MQIIKIPKNKIDASAIKKAVNVLKRGGVLVYPTETAYGLGCDFTNKKAREKIYKIKGRKASKKLPVIVGDMRMAKRYVKFDKASEKLAKKYWPGAFTMVLPCTPVGTAQCAVRFIRTEHCSVRTVRAISKKYFSTIALRISNHKIARLLAKKLGRPIVSTSANISGKGNCYSVEEILKQFKRKKYKPDLILDYGKLTKRVSSTVIAVEEGKVKILRQGGISNLSEFKRIITNILK